MGGGGGGGGETTPPARKVMLVADTNRESAGALQYALSHVVVENDELILIHVENPNSWRNTFSFLRRSSLPSSSAIANACEGGGGGGVLGDNNNNNYNYNNNNNNNNIEFLEAMKQVCQVAQPKIRVRIERVQMEGKDKANAILVKSKLLRVDLLIIGQRRSLSNAILGYKRSGGSGTKGLDTAEYLIENSKCTCVGVQKKGQNAGYLLNTKTHKNFWLLA